MVEANKDVDYRNNRMDVPMILIPQNRCPLIALDRGISNESPGDILSPVPTRYRPRSASREGRMCSPLPPNALDDEREDFFNASPLYRSISMASVNHDDDFA